MDPPRSGPGSCSREKKGTTQAGDSIDPFRRRFCRRPTERSEADVTNAAEEILTWGRSATPSDEEPDSNLAVCLRSLLPADAAHRPVLWCRSRLKPGRQNSVWQRPNKGESVSCTGGGENHPEPRVINSDKHAAYPSLPCFKPRAIRPTTVNTAPSNISKNGALSRPGLQQII
jgi:hypothetical protein